MLLQFTHRLRLQDSMQKLGSDFFKIFANYRLPFTSLNWHLHLHIHSYTLRFTRMLLPESEATVEMERVVVHLTKAGPTEPRWKRVDRNRDDAAEARQIIKIHPGREERITTTTVVRRAAVEGVGMVAVAEVGVEAEVEVEGLRRSNSDRGCLLPSNNLHCQLSSYCSML